MIDMTSLVYSLYHCVSRIS